MSKITYTYENNIKQFGETVSGEEMFSIVDSKGKQIAPMYCSGLDYELATFFVDWINEENIQPHGMTEILKIIKEREI